MNSPRILLLLLCLFPAASAATKPKVVTFGRWMPVKYFAGPDETTALELKVQPLLVNNEIKEYTIGESPQARSLGLGFTILNCPSRKISCQINRILLPGQPSIS